MALSMLKKCLASGRKWVLSPCLDGLLWLMTLFLGLLLAGQCLWFYGINTGKPIPLPNQGLVWVERILSQQLPGASISLNRMATTANGRIEARGLKVFLDGNPAPIATLEALEVQFSLTQLIMGKRHPESIRFRDGKLYCPPIYSPTGRREQVVQSFSGNLTRRNQQWHLDHLHGLAMGIPTTASGAWNFPLDMFSTNGGPQAGDPLFWAAAGLGQLLSYRQHTDWLRNPEIRLQFSQSTGNPPELDIQLQAEYLHLEGSLEWEKVAASGAIFWDRLWKLRRPFYLQAAHLKIPEKGTIKDLDVAVHISQEHGLNLAALYHSELKLASGRVDTPWGNARSLQARASSRAPGEMQFRIHTDINGSSLSADGNINVLFQSGYLRLHTRDMDWNPFQEQWGHLPFPLPESLEWPTKSHAHLRIHLAPGWRLDTLDFESELWDFQFKEQPIQNLFLKGQFLANDQKISIENYSVSFPNGQLSGNAEYFLPNNLLKLDVSSEGMDPNDLNRILPPWWEEIWEDFTFNGKLPSGQIRLEKQFYAQHTLYYFGSAEVWDATYRGLAFDRATTMIRGQPSFVEIYDLEASREEKYTRGSINWVFDPGIGGLKSMNWSIYSEVSPEDGKVIFVDAIRRIFDDFEVSGATEISSIGKIYNADRVPELKADDRVLVSGHSPNPLKYKGYPFDFLDFDADFSPEELQVVLRSVGVADGEAQGYFRTLKEGEDERLQFDIRLQQARRDGLMDLAQRFTRQQQPPEANVNEGEPVREPPAPEDSEDKARVDLQLEASGPMDNPYDFAGAGFFDLRDPDLARIRLFGLLSNILDQTPLPFGSLGLNRMASDLSLDGSTIHFPNMRVTGPVTRIKAKGDYSLINQNMDFSAQVFLGNPDESAFLSMITSIFRPITYALELNLTGPPDNPSWNFAYGPGAIFGVGRLPRESEFLPEPLPAEDPDEATPSLPIPELSAPHSSDPETFPPLP